MSGEKRLTKLAMRKFQAMRSRTICWQDCWTTYL